MVSDEEAELLLADFYDDEGYDDTETKQQQKPIRRFKRPKKIPLIAVLGRPNVGKSALVNRLAGTQSGGAIIADEEGITRDRTYRDDEFPSASPSASSIPAASCSTTRTRSSPARYGSRR